MDFVKTNTCLNLYLFVMLLVVSACSSNKNKKSYASAQKSYQEVKTTRVKFNFDQLFEIKEIRKGTSSSDIHVKGIGFQNSSNIIKFESVDPLESFLIGDINVDGFEELYIITRSTGATKKAKLIGIVSVNGKTYKPIYIPEYDNSLQVTFDYLNGYMGFDSIYLKEMNLHRDFPVFKNGNSGPVLTSEIRKLRYKLVEFNNSFSLQIQLNCASK